MRSCSYRAIDRDSLNLLCRRQLSRELDGNGSVCNCNSLHIMVTGIGLTSVTCDRPKGALDGISCAVALNVADGHEPGEGMRIDMDYFAPITNLAMVSSCMLDVPS